LVLNRSPPGMSPAISASSKCSGRTPAITSRAPVPLPDSSRRCRSSVSGASPKGSRIAPFSIRAGMKFMAGDPMKPATKRFLGVS
jgi:hypothetical protein